MKAGPRQYTLMLPGTLCGSGDAPYNGWNRFDATSGNGQYYYYQSKLDLRGLDDLGLQPLSVTLQEGGIVSLHTAETSAIIYDVLTTVRPTEESMAEWWLNINNQGNPPGFLSGALTASFPTDQDTQTFNPSQVCWGLWRLFGINGTFRLSATDFPTQTIASGYFGQGEIQVPPSMWWTRLVICDDDGTSIGIPSSNLVVYADAQSMSAPEEMTAMMRSVQR